MHGAEIIKELKAAILAIEWEITDEAMDNLTRAIESLQKRWAGKKPLLVCLQVLGTLGQYIKKSRERAHQDAINLLPVVFATLETVVTDDVMDNGRKIVLVRETVEKYNRLKTELAKPRKTVAREVFHSSVAERVREAAPAAPGKSPIRDILDQKEDQAVDGAFNAIFQEMVGDDRRGAPGQKAPAPVPPAMPSAAPQAGPDAKEVVLARVDDEEFPEADSLLDDFFSESGLDFSMAEVKAEPVMRAAEETVEVDLGRIEVKREDVAERGRPVSEVEEEEVSLVKLERIIHAMRAALGKSLLTDLAEEIASLRSQYPNHLSVLLFLEFIASLGRHLDEHGDVARDLSLNMLETFYDRLSHALFTMQPQKNLLASHLDTINDYVTWQALVAGELAEARTVAAPAPVQEMAEEMSAGMLAAVRGVVQREVAELRRELLQLIKQR